MIELDAPGLAVRHEVAPAEDTAILGHEDWEAGMLTERTMILYITVPGFTCPTYICSRMFRARIDDGHAQIICRVI